MKRCPTCEKTFDDVMRFCQADGTPLIDAAEPVDPYKTMVARPGEIAAAIPKSSFDSSMNESTAPPKTDQDEVLQLPKEDSKKTTFASEDEIRREMASQPADEQVIEIPPLAEAPKFKEPSMSPPNFGDLGSAPPSPFRRRRTRQRRRHLIWVPDATTRLFKRRVRRFRHLLTNLSRSNRLRRRLNRQSRSIRLHRHLTLRNRHRRNRRRRRVFRNRNRSFNSLRAARSISRLLRLRHRTSGIHLWCLMPAGKMPLRRRTRVSGHR
jgi:hypothetical protein